jgi:hypothetical protein
MRLLADGDVRKAALEMLKATRCRLDLMWGFVIFGGCQKSKLTGIITKKPGIDDMQIVLI